MKSTDLLQLQRDPARFRAALVIDSDAGPVRFGTVAEPYQTRDAAALEPALRRLVGQEVDVQHSRAWLERPRGHSKTCDTAMTCEYVLFAARRKLTAVAAAGDADQAGLLRQEIDKHIRLNGWLSAVLDVQKNVVVNRITGSTLVIISSDAASSYGLTPDLIVVDELTHWKKRDLWDSLLSSAAKRRSNALIAISNAGYQDTWQWELREAVRQDPRWYFSALAGPTARWITADRLDEQRRLLPQKVYARLWLNQWASGGGDALEEADIAASLTLPAPLPAAEPGYSYVAGLDLGLTRDASALVVLGRHVGHMERRPRPIRQRVVSPAMRTLVDAGVFEQITQPEPYDITYREPTGRLKLAAVRVWRPINGQRVSIEAVENEILQLDAKFGLSAVAYDPWQAEYLAERLTKLKVRTDPTPFMPQNLQSMAQATIEAFGNRLLELFPHADLLTDLRALRIVEKSYGIRLDSPRGVHGHGDIATALAIALHSVKRFSAARRTPRLERPLVIHPSLN